MSSKFVIKFYLHINVLYPKLFSYIIIVPITPENAKTIFDVFLTVHHSIDFFKLPT